MGSYMLTAFWMILIYALWPKLKPRLRLVCFVGLTLTLYAVAVAGRRSVYLSLIVGLLTLAAVVFAANRGKKLRLLVTAAFIVLFLGGLYTVGDIVSPQTAFFKRRVGQIDDRLRQAAGLNRQDQTTKSFFVLQREGVKMAFTESPILGIGWGGFPASRFSPTGHEVHSTPLRFLAELGLIGMTLYLTLMALLLGGSWRLYRAMRLTPYSASYLALMVAIWSMSVSYVYNRHVTERTFWVFLVVFLAADAFATRWHELRASLEERQATASRGLAVNPPVNRQLLTTAERRSIDHPATRSTMPLPR
jgi:hypothetical protein